MNGTATAYQMKNTGSYQLRRISNGSAILNKQYNRCICMTPIKMTETFTTNRWYTSYRKAVVSGVQDHTL